MKVSEAFYATDWNNLSLHNQKLLLLVMSLGRQTLHVTAGKFYTFSLYGFIDVSKYWIYVCMIVVISDNSSSLTRADVYSINNYIQNIRNYIDDIYTIHSRQFLLSAENIWFESFSYILSICYVHCGKHFSISLAPWRDSTLITTMVEFKTHLKIYIEITRYLANVETVDYSLY